MAGSPRNNVKLLPRNPQAAQFCQEGKTRPVMPVKAGDGVESGVTFYSQSSLLCTFPPGRDHQGTRTEWCCPQGGKWHPVSGAKAGKVPREKATDFTQTEEEKEAEIAGWR